MTKPLFSAESLSDYLLRRRRALAQQIDALDADQLLSYSPETLAANLAERDRLEPLRLIEEQIRVDTPEARVDARFLPDRVVRDSGTPIWVDATQAEVAVPYQGTQDLLRMRPNRYGPNPPEASIIHRTLHFSRTWSGTPDEATVTNWVKQSLREISECMRDQDDELHEYNNGLYQDALSAITVRRDNVLAKRRLQASLPFKMTPRADAPFTFAPEGIVKKPIVPVLSSLPGAVAFQPEAALSDAQFEDVLKTIRAIGRSMERTPSTFAKLGEEDLRSVFLAALNAQFEGAATGETFNASGKTDILIRYQDRNVFVGECKIWKGPSGVPKALDQLLGYLVWRDGHAALLLFVKAKGISDILTEIAVLVRAHPNYLQDARAVSAAEQHFRMSLPGDVSRELTLAVLAFHFPA